jgi:propanediol dehydratase large subunit
MSLFKDRLFENHSFQSSFELNVDQTELTVEIIDLGIGGVSAATDMDNILNATQDEGLDLENYQVMYRDPQGNWDTVIIANYEVLGARFVPAFQPTSSRQPLSV